MSDTSVQLEENVEALMPRQTPPGPRVLTYGTWDLLHESHMDHLRKCRALGRYLVVSVKSDTFNAGRGKRFLAQNVLQRAEAVRKTGLVDEVIIEECEDKVNDVLKHGIDIVAMQEVHGAPDDMPRNLRRYCQFVLISEDGSLPDGTLLSSITSTAQRGTVSLGVIGSESFVESLFCDMNITSNRKVGVKIEAIMTTDRDQSFHNSTANDGATMCDSLPQILDIVDAIYVASDLGRRFEDVRSALEAGKHVLCESPLSLSKKDAVALFRIAAEKDLILLESIRSAFTPTAEKSNALAQNGNIGRVLSVEVNMSLPLQDTDSTHSKQPGAAQLGEALLPVVRILHGRKVYNIACKTLHADIRGTALSKITIDYGDAMASVNIGHGVPLPETLTVLGSNGHLAIPAPWREAEGCQVEYSKRGGVPVQERFEFPTAQASYRYDMAEFASVILLNKQQSHMLTIENSINLASLLERLLRCEVSGKFEDS